MNNLARNLRQLEQFFVSKEDAYKQAGVDYYLAPYNHPMMTKTYLNKLLRGEVVCPKIEHVIHYASKLEIKKYAIAGILLESEFDFGFEITKLPPKKWLIAAYRALDPEEELIVLLVLRNQIYFGVINERENDYTEDITDLYRAISTRSFALNEEGKRKWNTACLGTIYLELDEIMSTFRFLTLAASFAQNLENIENN